MNTCPHHKIRSDLPPLTPRIAQLPVDERGYPVPFFVVWLDEKGSRVKPGTGKPEFRAMDPVKLKACVKEKLCWVCGEPLGAYKVFVLGPMCTVNRVSAEPPSHLECAEWSVKGCPFLTKPQMVRRESGLPDHDPAPGVMIKDNPGVMALWTTRSYSTFWAGNGSLFKIGDKEQITWWKEGRTATVDEVIAAIELGLPRLVALCGSDEERAELDRAANGIRALVQGCTHEAIQTRG